MGLDSLVVVDDNRTFSEVSINELCSKSQKIAFYPSSDTLVYSFYPVIKELVSRKFDSQITVFCPAENPEGADKAIGELFKEIEVEVKGFSLFDYIFKAYDVLVLANDWSPDAKQIIAWSRLKKVKVVCLQESVINFDYKYRRMRYADVVLIQGAQSAKHLDRKRAVLVGNPRYEDLNFANRADFSKVLVNVNFTYGVYEEWREKWLKDIADSCNDLDLQFKISQHPRDTGDLSRYGAAVLNSHAGAVHDQLANSDILITRFSSLIHEGLEMGLKVIYYNPHNEELFYDFGANNSSLFVVQNKEELENALSLASSGQLDLDKKRAYAELHYRPSTNLPSSLIARLLQSHNLIDGDYDSTDKEFIGFKYSIVRPIFMLFKRMF